LYIPMSKLEENMQAAQRRSACTEERFWFRTKVLPEEQEDAKAPYAFMTIHEILMGFETFPGLIPLCRRHLDATGCDAETRRMLDQYLLLIERRAAGSLMTPAAWMRQFVLRHGSYQQDGRVPPAAAHDLMVVASEIGEGKRQCAPLLGDACVPEVGRLLGGLPSPCRRCRPAAFEGCITERMALRCECVMAS